MIWKNPSLFFSRYYSTFQVKGRDITQKQTEQKDNHVSETPEIKSRCTNNTIEENQMKNKPKSKSKKLLCPK